MALDISLETIIKKNMKMDKTWILGEPDVT